MAITDKCSSIKNRVLFCENLKDYNLTKLLHLMRFDTQR